MSLRSSELRLLEKRMRCRPRSWQRGCPCKRGHRRKTAAIPVSRDQRDRKLTRIFVMMAAVVHTCEPVHSHSRASGP